MKVSLSALALRLSEQQLRDSLRLVEHVARLQALSHGECELCARSDQFVRPIVRSVGRAHGSARAAWQLALRRVKDEQLRQRGWVFFPGYFERRRRRVVE